MANRRFIDFPIASSVGDNDIVLIWQDGLNKQTTKGTLIQGAPTSLEGLTDVDIAGLINGQILQYNSVTGKWENVDRTDINLSQLGDVSIVSPSNGQVLVYNSSTSKWENSSAGYVPYVGAVTTVDLGAQTIQAGSFVKAGGTAAQFLKANGSVDSNTYLTTGSAAATYVPYTGATADVNLGTHDLTAERGTFQNNGSSDTLTVNHTSGSGKGINVSKGGNGEALLVTKTSGSGNAMAVVGGRTALVDLSLSSVSNATGNFLTISGGVVHQRTPSETRSDVGAQAQLNGTGFVKASGTTISYDNSTYQVTSEKGQPNGYASLDSNGKVPLVQINDALIGNVNFQGLWNAATNTPTLANPPASGTKGHYYIVSTAGTFASISFEVGDWIISDGTAWGKVDNTDAVSSVFGRTGNVTAANGDYTTAQVTESGNLYYTDGRARAAISLTTTGASGSSTYNNSTGVLNVPAYTLSGLGGIGGTIASGQVAFGTAANTIGGDAAFTWDNTNKILSVVKRNAGTALIVDNNGSFSFEGILIKGGNINDNFALRIQSSNESKKVLLRTNANGFLINVETSNNLEFATANFTRWIITNTGILQSNGVQTIQTSTGALTLQSGNRNVLINTTTDAGFRLDVNGTGRFSGALSIIGNIDVLAGGVGSSFNRQISLGSGTAYNYQVRANDDDFQLREAGSHVFLAYTYGGSLGTGTIRLYNNTVSTASFTGTSFIRSGGTSSQFLKADGSVDSNTYVTGGPFLPLTGGTLTGALNGTSATFTSSVTAGTGSLFNANSGTLTQDILTVRGGGASGAFGFRVEANNGDDLLFVNALSYNVIIGATGGNLLVGTTTDNGAKLQVTVTGDNTRAVSVIGTTTRRGYLGHAFGSLFIQNNIFFNGSSYVFDDTSVGSSTITLGETIAFQTGAANTNPSTKVTITNDGNVLIGTATNGASKLRIVGLPTSAVGLSSGDVYNLSGVLMIA
jgi:hypothetical protein